MPEQIKKNPNIEEAFELFKRLSLQWKINFTLLPLGKECISRTRANPIACVADIEFNKEVPQEYLTKEEIDRCARHEMIHVLTRKLRMLADNRFVSPPEINMAEEELTKKLEEILK